MILLPRYRRRQPSGPLEIDRSNPITRGLATVYLPTVRYPGTDLVTKVIDTATIRGVLLPSQNGVVYSTTTASNWSIRFAPVGIPGSYPALSVFTLFEQYDTTSTGTIFGGGNNSTQYARFNKENTGAISFIPNSNTGASGITGPVLNTHQVYALAAINQGSERELFVDAASVASSSTAISFLNAAYGFAGSEFPAAGNQRRVGIYCGYVWTRRLTLSEIKSLTDNPWQIFRPQRLVLPVNVGGAVTHGTTGVLTGQGSTIVGSAARLRDHPTSGTLTGPGSSIVGSAARTRQHSTAGALPGLASIITGNALHSALHTTTGLLVGPGSVITGNAARSGVAVIHDTSGALIGPGSQISGVASIPPFVIADVGAEYKSRKKQDRKREEELQKFKEEQEKLRKAIEQAVSPVVEESKPVVVAEADDVVRVVSITGTQVSVNVPVAFDAAEVAREVAQVFESARIEATRVQAQRAAAALEAARLEHERKLRKRRRDDELLLLM
jgi:hypothetical protein